MTTRENFQEPDSVEVPYFNIHPPKEDPYGSFQLMKSVNLQNIDEKNKRILSEHEERLKVMKERYKQMGMMRQRVRQPRNARYVYDQTKSYTDSMWKKFTGVFEKSWWFIGIVIAIFIAVFMGLKKLLEVEWLVSWGKQARDKPTMEQRFKERKDDFFRIPQNNPPIWRR